MHCLAVSSFSTIIKPPLLPIDLRTGIEYSSFFREKKKLEERITVLNSKKLSLIESESKTQNYLKTKESLEKKIYDIDKKIYEQKVALANYPKIAELQEELTALDSSKNDLEKTIKEMTLSFSSLKPEIDKLKIQAKREADSVYLLRENLLNQRNLRKKQGKVM